MKKFSFAFSIALTIAILTLSIIPNNPLQKLNWAVISVLILGLALVAMFWRFEKADVTAQEVALIATMSAFAAVSRVAFAFIMSVQPTTFFVMITGYVFGAQTGFLVGALSALVSNFFLGHGPWTPWQMFSWGLCGVLASLLAGHKESFNYRGFLILSVVSGYLFGWIMNLWHWVGFIYPLTWKTFFATYAVSFPFDTVHSLGNVIFAVLFSQLFYDILLRFKNKIRVVYIDSE
ncbi:MAG: ECF transporter S component [Clostridia bacterium]|nr:ECF transporter S component [Clostridia bacterium]MDD4048848.1 ECF transporter S component [Clostridia bacterium]